MTTETGRRDAGDLTDAVVPTVWHWESGVAGPCVAILGGVHGDEYEGVLAARRIAAAVIDTARCGSVRIAAPAHPQAFAARQRRNPIDGHDLARRFPGDAEGSETDRVAAHLVAELLTGADLLIDLHSAGTTAAMPVLCGHFSEVPESPAAAAAAAAFAAPFTWLHPEQAPGRSLSAAAERGIPAIYAESRGRGVVTNGDIGDLVDGVLRVLHHVGILDHSPAPRHRPHVVRGDGNTDGGIAITAEGVLVWRAVVGELLAAGDTLLDVVSPAGEVLQRVTAAVPSALMMARTAPWVVPGDAVAILADLVGSGDG